MTDRLRSSGGCTLQGAVRSEIDHELADGPANIDKSGLRIYDI
jgi:hypothetical protein